MTLTHYVIVRRDLPVGVLLAMVAHAAGESFYQLRPDSSGSEHRTFSPGVGSSPLPRGSTFNPAETIAIVLGARNEGRLARAARALAAAGVPFVEIRETDGAFAGQVMAIGVVPGEKETIGPIVNEFHMLKELECHG